MMRVNFRVLLLLAIVALIVGYPAYLFIDTLVSGGIHDARDSRGAYKEVDLKSISLFEMDQGAGTDEDIPRQFRDLNGQRVQMVGEMYMGSAAAGGQADFQLCYSIAKCCFTGRPKVQHFVKAMVKSGREVPFYPGLVEVMGVLRVGVEREGPQILSVYRLEVESIRPRR